MSVRVLLVDDVADYRLLVRLVLEEAGEIEVVGEADNGRDGVRLAGELRPDVILLDLSMPDLDGLEAIPRIRARSPETCILVLSGFESARMGPTAEEAGADGYLEKGIPLPDLRERVLDCTRATVPGP